MQNLLLVLAMLSIAISCKEDDITETPKGSIQVTVTNSQNQPVENAEVVLVNFDSPLSSTIKFSNADGIVLFNELDTSDYVLTANKTDVGMASSVVVVEESIQYDVSLQLIKENINYYAPSIYMIEPEYSSVSIMPIDTVDLLVQVMDDDTPSSGLAVTATCDIDGQVFSGSPNGENVVNFQLYPTTKGVHNITITAEDKNGLSTTENLTVNAVEVVPTVLTTTKQYKKVLLEWADNVEQDFQRIEVKRWVNSNEGYQTLATITDATVTSYVDSVIPYLQSTNYKITTYDSEGRYADSNISNVKYPAGMFFYYTYDSDIKDVLVHPTRDWVYLIIGETGGQKIIVYDYIKDEIFKEVNLSYTPGYSILADNGSGLQLFIPGRDGSINIYSTDEELSLVKSITTGDQCTSLGVNGNGIIVAGMDLGYNEEYATRSYSQSTGALIDSTGTYTEIRVVGVPNKQNVFIGIDYTSSIRNMRYLEIDNAGNFISDIEDSYFTEYDYTYWYLFVAASGDYIICESDIFNTDSGLQHITSFASTTIRGAVTNTDGSIIYTHDFYIENKITAFGYPALDQIAQYDTREKPKVINLKGTKIIALTENNTKSIIEIIDL
ncbi:MAG: carboxypeptidase-like regulatory domain-containing protein [Candidatus Cyclobacteriaceae bacterium M2_1C_046]